ncbi:TIGR03546 family protein [Marinicellulosiphila megalodicopiae]|uniref:TIGR03546 family protein n=1 Tax=Marinicellulosiphila megalodicopiae TaxID=2724896 RepID=UPI003BAFFDF9
MLKMIASLLKSISNDSNPYQLAFAVSFAMVFSFLPFFTFLSIIVLFCLLSFRINLAMFLLGCAFFKTLAFSIDPLLIKVGESVLMQASLTGMFDSAFNSDFLRLFHFNHTLVMGAMVVSFVCFVPVLFISKILIVRYRVHLLTRINKLHIVQLLKASNKLNWLIR